MVKKSRTGGRPRGAVQRKAVALPSGDELTPLYTTFSEGPHPEIPAKDAQALPDPEDRWRDLCPAWGGAADASRAQEAGAAMKRPAQRGPTAARVAAERDVMASKIALINTTKADEIALVEHAEAIRVLGRRVIGDAIEIGRRLVDAKDRCGHGNWLPWLDREFGWTDDTALNFMRVYEMSKSRNIRDLSIPVTGLYLLAAPSTPDEVRDEVIERAENGEHLSTAQIKDMVDKAVVDTRAELEAQLDSMRAEALQRETEIRAEYDGSEQLQTKIDKAISKATASLHKQIEQYETKLAKIKERDERRAKPKKKGDTSPDQQRELDAAKAHAADLETALELACEAQIASNTAALCEIRAAYAKAFPTDIEAQADELYALMGIILGSKTVTEINGVLNRMAQLGVRKPADEDDSDPVPNNKAGCDGKLFEPASFPPPQDLIDQAAK
jgi:hypothetical protein